MRLSLVTGGSGFIGQHLVRALVARGERVRVYDLRAPDGLDGAVRDCVEFRQGDITDAAAVEGAMTGVGRVFHLAANPNLWSRNPDDFARVNHGGTETVMAAAERHRPERVVYTSTESILAGRRGRRTGSALIDEDVSLGVDDMPGSYCRSKFLAERAAMEAAARGLPVVIVNPTLPIGPGDTLITPPSRMLLDFLNGQAPAFLEAEVNTIDVRDAAAGHILAAERGRVGQRYILGGENITMSAMLRLLADIAGRPMPRRRIPYWLALAYAAADEFIADHITGRAPRAPLAGVRLVRRPMYFDNSKALRELGLEPRPLRQSLTDAVEWFRAQGLLRDDPSQGSRHGGRPGRRGYATGA